MAAASATPLGAGSQFSSVGRRISTRQTTRRFPSKSRSSGAEASDRGYSSADGGIAAIPASRTAPDDYVEMNESSDEEIPVPMKLSALTKALLNDGQACEVSSMATSLDQPSTLSPPRRPSSRTTSRKGVLVASTSSHAEAEQDGLSEVSRVCGTRRHARANSTALPSPKKSSPMQSRETSPVPRKRVVRLSGTPGIVSLQGSLRRSLSTSTRKKTASYREPPMADMRPASMTSTRHDTPNNIKTPVVPVRSVAVVVGSSTRRSRSGQRSAFEPRSASDPASEHATPANAARGSVLQSMGRDASASRYVAGGRKDEGAAQGSMRVKRIGQVAGSFLSGPARRGGKRRQSEEDGEAQCEGEGAEVVQDAANEQLHDADPDFAERPPEGRFGVMYRGLAASGSPVSGKDDVHATGRKGARKGRGHVEREQELPGQLGEPACEGPKPPLNVGKDNKENVKPVDSRRSPLAGSSPVRKDIGKISAMLVDSAVCARPAPAPASPARKALAPKNQNTPHGRSSPQPPPRMTVVDTATTAAGAAAGAQGIRKRQMLLRVNGRIYTRIDCIGRGGSSKVYRVSAESGKMLALKRVSLELADEQTVKGFKGEIDLLKKLEGVDRVIQLIDSELNVEKRTLSVLLELGELDLHTLLKSRQSTPDGAKLDPVFIRFYWKEMLECVRSVHAMDVVHSDLKPANFVLVQGRLKLIDFGIANAIQTEMTVNVHRETQVGTPNYMSPESLMDSNQYAFTSSHSGRPGAPPPHQRGNAPHKVTKLGKPSDVWSLGCILYQMVYGIPPFGKIATQMARCQAIINWAYAIDFPEMTDDGTRVPPSIIRSMRRCLNRAQSERPTCEEMLAATDPFLYPHEFVPAVINSGEGKVLPMTEDLLSRIIQSVAQRCRERLPTEGEAMSAWPHAYWTSVKKAVSATANQQEQR